MMQDNFFESPYVPWPTPIVPLVFVEREASVLLFPSEAGQQIALLDGPPFQSIL